MCANLSELVDEDWAEALSVIPIDLEETTQETKALQRRREIKTAADLLRLVLAYSVCDWSLRLEPISLLDGNPLDVIAKIAGPY